MSFERRHGNPGKREREARKRHRRGRVWSSTMPAASAPLKVGRTHFGRLDSKIAKLWRARSAEDMAVAESEKRANGAPES